MRGRSRSVSHAHAFRLHSVSFERLEDPQEPLALGVLRLWAAHLESHHLDRLRLDTAVCVALGGVRLTRRVVHRLDVCHSLTCGRDEEGQRALVLGLLFLFLGVLRDLACAVHVVRQVLRVGVCHPQRGDLGRLVRGDHEAASWPAVVLTLLVAAVAPTLARDPVGRELLQRGLNLLHTVELVGLRIRLAGEVKVSEGLRLLRELLVLQTLVPEDPPREGQCGHARFPSPAQHSRRGPYPTA